MGETPYWKLAVQNAPQPFTASFLNGNAAICFFWLARACLFYYSAQSGTLLFHLLLFAHSGTLLFHLLLFAQSSTLLFHLSLKGEKYISFFLPEGHFSIWSPYFSATLFLWIVKNGKAAKKGLP